MIFGILISILNIVSVYYATKNDKMTWIIGLFPAIITTILFTIDGLWLSAIFNFYSFIICILGIIYLKNSAKENSEDVIGINDKSIMHMLYVLLGFVFLYLINLIFNFNIYDVFGTYISVIATYLLYKKEVIAWIYWIFNDVLYILMGICTDNPEYIVIYFVLMIMAMRGLFKNLNKF